ncbi:MAG: thioredoxin family protein [Flavobacteriales bacterium]
MNLIEYQAHWAKAKNGGIYPADYQPYLELNEARFKRITKTYTPSTDFTDAVQGITKPTHWIIITEPWCGDAAQSVPLLLKLINEIPKATFTIELRDQSSLIDQYLTNGGKGIPKVIVRDEQEIDLLVWGPRTREAQALFNEQKAAGVELTVLHEALHSWYAKDQGKTLELELLTLIQGLL